MYANEAPGEKLPPITLDIALPPNGDGGFGSFLFGGPKFLSMGKYFAMDRYPVLVPSQQNFFVSLNFPQPTRPTLGASRAVYSVLDGIFGRETQ